jgi:hypothetical protein
MPLSDDITAAWIKGWTIYAFGPFYTTHYCNIHDILCILTFINQPMSQINSQVFLYFLPFPSFFWSWESKFEDTKRVMRSRKSKKDKRKNVGQKKNQRSTKHYTEN